MDSLKASVRVNFKVKVSRSPQRVRDSNDYIISVSEETPKRVLTHQLNVSVPFGKEPEGNYQFPSLPDKVANKVSEMIAEIHASSVTRLAGGQGRWKA